MNSRSRSCWPKRRLLALVALLNTAWIGTGAWHGRQARERAGADPAMKADMEVFHFLLAQPQGHPAGT